MADAVVLAAVDSTGARVESSVVVSDVWSEDVKPGWTLGSICGKSSSESGSSAGSASDLTSGAGAVCGSCWSTGLTCSVAFSGATGWMLGSICPKSSSEMLLVDTEPVDLASRCGVSRPKHEASTAFTRESRLRAGEGAGLGARTMPDDGAASTCRSCSVLPATDAERFTRDEDGTRPKHAAIRSRTARLNAKPPCRDQSGLRMCRLSSARRAAGAASRPVLHVGNREHRLSSGHEHAAARGEMSA
jgi:hypothetical protein